MTYGMLSSNLNPIASVPVAAINDLSDYTEVTRTLAFLVDTIADANMADMAAGVAADTVTDVFTQMGGGAGFNSANHHTRTMQQQQQQLIQHQPYQPDVIAAAREREALEAEARQAESARAYHGRQRRESYTDHQNADYQQQQQPQPQQQIVPPLPIAGRRGSMNQQVQQQQYQQQQSNLPAPNRRSTFPAAQPQQQGQRMTFPSLDANQQSEDIPRRGRAASNGSDSPVFRQGAPPGVGQTPVYVSASRGRPGTQLSTMPQQRPSTTQSRTTASPGAGQGGTPSGGQSTQGAGAPGGGVIHYVPQGQLGLQYVQSVRRPSLQGPPGKRM